MLDVCCGSILMYAVYVAASTLMRAHAILLWHPYACAGVMGAGVMGDEVGWVGHTCTAQPCGADYASPGLHASYHPIIPPHHARLR